MKKITLIVASLLAVSSFAAIAATAAKPSAKTAASAPAATTKTASGIEMTVITPGSGAFPKASDVVKVNYRGTLQNGQEFDSSYKRGQPAIFPLNRVIPCWTEGVQKIQVGGKTKLVCPSNLAYGPQGIPGTIPPDATLVFEVELLEIQK